MMASVEARRDTDSSSSVGNGSKKMRLRGRSNGSIQPELGGTYRARAAAVPLVFSRLPPPLPAKAAGAHIGLTANSALLRGEPRLSSELLLTLPLRARQRRGGETIGALCGPISPPTTVLPE